MAPYFVSTSLFLTWTILLINTIHINAQTTSPTTSSPSTFRPSTTESPTKSPSKEPTSSPSPDPTLIPSPSPTKTPTFMPSLEPTPEPTTEPTHNPSLFPSDDPTNVPTDDPTDLPSSAPSTSSPSFLPTSSPTNITTTAQSAKASTSTTGGGQNTVSSDSKVSSDGSSDWEFRCFSPSLDLFGTAGCSLVSTLILLCCVMLCVQGLIIVYCCFYLPRIQRIESVKAEAVLSDDTAMDEVDEMEQSNKEKKGNTMEQIRGSVHRMASLHKERVSSCESQEKEDGVEMMSYHDSDDEVLNNDDEKELEYITPGGPDSTHTPGE